jgi:hypothetical protein
MKLFQGPFFKKWKDSSIVRVLKSITGIIGALLVVMGGIWILQGLNLAWGPLARSIMQNDRHWVVYGAILAIAGLGLIAWAYKKPKD